MCPWTATAGPWAAACRHPVLRGSCPWDPLPAGRPYSGLVCSCVASGSSLSARCLQKKKKLKLTILFEVPWLLAWKRLEWLVGLLGVGERPGHNAAAIQRCSPPLIRGRAAPLMGTYSPWPSPPSCHSSVNRAPWNTRNVTSCAKLRPLSLAIPDT
jgi:hypothetical protein